MTSASTRGGRPPKLILITLIVVLALIWMKFSLIFPPSLLVTLVPLAFVFLVLGYLSPPVAVALLFMSHALLGELGDIYKTVFVQFILAIPVLLSAGYVRWQQGNLFSLTQRKNDSIAFVIIVIVFTWGFVNALAHNGIALDGFLSQLKGTQAANYAVWHIVFVSRWAAFIALGMLAVSNRTDFKIFLSAFSFLFIAQLLAIPSEIYGNFLSSANQNGDLSLQSDHVNRVHLGYLAVISSIIALAGAYRPNTNRLVTFAYSGWFMLTGITVILAGSKGPLITFAIGAALLMQLAGKSNLKKTVLLMTLFFMLTMFALSLSKQQSQQSQQYAVVDHYIEYGPSSVSVRKDMYIQSFQAYSTYGNWGEWLFGRGLGASVLDRQLIASNTPFTMRSGSHNLFVDLLLDVGLVGLILLADL